MKTIQIKSDRLIYCVSHLKQANFIKTGLCISKTGLNSERLTVLLEVREHAREIRYLILFIRGVFGLQRSEALWVFECVSVDSTKSLFMTKLTVTVSIGQTSWEV